MILDYGERELTSETRAYKSTSQLLWFSLIQDRTMPMNLKGPVYIGDQVEFASMFPRDQQLGTY